MNLGRAIRIARAARGLSQDELAGKSKIASSYVSLIEAGHKNPSMAVLARVSKALGVESSTLVLMGSEQIAKDNDTLLFLGRAFRELCMGEKK